MPTEASDEWTRVEATFTVPEASDFLRIMCNMEGRGEVWIDDMLLEEVSADGSASELMRPETPPDHEFMLQWVELYSGEGRPYLLFGRMLHPPALDCATIEQAGFTWPAVLHNAYRAPDGAEAVVLVNATDEQQQATLAWGGREHELTFKPWEAKLVR